MNSKSLKQAFADARSFISDDDWWLSLQLNCGEDAVCKMLTSEDGAATRRIEWAADALDQVAQLMRMHGLSDEAQDVQNAASELKRARAATVARGQVA